MAGEGMTRSFGLRFLMGMSVIAVMLAVFSAVPVFAGTITVTNTADSGAGSLRAAIAAAAPGDTINFSLALPATITLTSGELLISKNLTINGPGASSLAINANNLSRVERDAGENLVIVMREGRLKA